ncbi:MAG TPA: sugar-binding protein, partial [Cytophagales bacterium]|nr:sugar-binding protein [Cytophagales bacterium]
MNNCSKLLLLFCVFLVGVHFCGAQNGPYKAYYAQQAPQIDGDTSDAVWKDIETWYTYNQVWLNNAGSTPTPEDFSWKFKLSWTKDRFYILAVITDDSISDRYPNALDRYYEDDCFEVFFDEDKSGGQHQRSFQAFAYHVSLKYDIVDSDASGAAKLLNDHAEVRMDTIDGKYVWEAAFKVYDKNFTLTNPGQPVSLFAGKKMGWALSYCDNDGRAQRDHFFGSEYVSATDKNIAYINADVFGTVELINPAVPSFSHVLVDNGLINPTAMQIAANGDIYVCEQKGNLKVLQNGVLQAVNLVHVNANTEGPSYTERGLLGLALDPNFSHNHHIYLFYTTSEGFVHNRVSRFTLDGLKDVSSTEAVITELDSLSSAFNHNGGA